MLHCGLNHVLRRRTVQGLSSKVYYFSLFLQEPII